LEELAGEIVQVSGPTDASGFASVERAAREAQTRVMKTGGGSHAALEALEAMAELAARAAKGEVPPSIDARSVLSLAASELPFALRGEVARATHALSELRRALEARPHTALLPLPTAAAPISLPREAKNIPTTAVNLQTLSLTGDRAILDGFVVEAREHLANAEARLLDLEQSPRDAQVVND